MPPQNVVRPKNRPCRFERELRKEPARLLDLKANAVKESDGAIAVRIGVKHDDTIVFDSVQRLLLMTWDMGVPKAQHASGHVAVDQMPLARQDLICVICFLELDLLSTISNDAGLFEHEPDPMSGATGTDARALLASVSHFAWTFVRRETGHSF